MQSQVGYWNSPKKAPSSKLFVAPNFMREISRLADLFGNLDDYNYSKKADSEALGRDYSIALAELQKTLEDYAKEDKR